MSETDPTSAPSGVTIKHRFTDEVLFQSETATTLRAAVIEAVKAVANLRFADLRFANLGSANLGSADLRSADLRFANLRFANLGSADLRFANLGSANLGFANLVSADLRFADLGFANLAGTTCLSITGLPSGHAILAPLPDGWRLTIGCWGGTVQQLRELIAKDTGWPDASGDQIVERRPMLAALADMCDAWTVTNTHVLEEVQAKWAPKADAAVSA